MTARLLRFLIPALVLAATAAAPASAQAPLTGTGENIQPITRLPIANINEVELAGDWAFVSDEVGAGDEVGGLTIVNIADPTKPFIESRWDCPGGWADVDLNPEATIAVLTNGHQVECLDGNTMVAIIDIRDKKNPKLLSSLQYEADIPYVHTATLDRNLLYLNPQAAAFFPQGTEPHIPIYDISDPVNPVRKGSIQSQGVGLAHDTYVDHRPDGKDLLYSASIHTTDIFDVTDPFNATMIQRVAQPDITISHDVQPNHDRTILVVDDEGAAGGQLDEAVSVCGKFGVTGPLAYDSGSVHFFEAAPDGTFANEGAVPLGSFNAPINVNEGACVAHVFWQAPDQNRMTQAYYRIGGYVIDFEDPANPVALGNFRADAGSNYWSFKPHRGYLFGSNQDAEGGSLDILKFTGAGWPADSGPAEVQRAARHGVPYKPLTSGSSTVSTAPLPSVPADTRAIGRVKFTARLKRLPGRRGKRARVTFTFYDAKGKRVGTARTRKSAGRSARVRVSGGAVAGRYRWVAKVGRRTVGRGRFTVRKRAGQKLATTQTLAVRAK